MNLKEAGQAIKAVPIATMVNHGTNQLFIDNLTLPREALIGEEGKGFSYVLSSLNAERILVGSESNFGAPPLAGVGLQGSFLSIDPSGADILSVPANFASGGGQASALNGACRYSPPTARTGSTRSTIPTRTLLSTAG